MYRLKQNGFTLIEALMGLGLLGITVSAMAMLQSTISAGSNNLQRKNNYNGVINNLQERLAYNTTCAEAIGPASPGLGGTQLILLDSDDTNSSGTADWRENIGKEISILANDIETASTNVAANSTFNSLGLKINSLVLADVYPLDPPDVPPAASPTEEYIGKVFLQMVQTNAGNDGLVYRRILLSGLKFRRDTTTGAVTECSGSLNLSRSAMCKAMGCTFDSSLAFASQCQCPAVVTGCATPGEYPVGVVDGKYVCKSLGDPSNPCGAGRYLTGVGLGKNFCCEVNMPPTDPSCQ